MGWRGWGICMRCTRFQVLLNSGYGCSLQRNSIGIVDFACWLSAEIGFSEVTTLQPNVDLIDANSQFEAGGLQVHSRSLSDNFQQPSAKPPPPRRPCDLPAVRIVRRAVKPVGNAVAVKVTVGAIGLR